MSRNPHKPTPDLRILQAMAAEHDCIVQRGATAATGETVTDLVLDENAACGTFAQQLRDALRDGVITQNEMRAIGAAGLAEQKVMMALLSRLRDATGRRLHAVDQKLG